MLNSNKGGILHIGLSSKGRVEGIHIDFNKRDGFRSGKPNSNQYIVILGYF